jgi:zinc transport system permease protein
MLEILKYDFIQNAIFASILLSIACGLIGTYIVINRIVFISSGISHGIFGGVGIAHYLKLDIVWGALSAGIIYGFLYEKISIFFGERKDTVIGILLAFGMAIGILFIYLTPGYSQDLFSYLFGNILMVSTSELWYILLFNIVIIVFLIFYYQVIRIISFDEEFSFILGLPVKFINTIMTLSIIIAIILLIKAVGIILVTAMFTIPPSIANKFTHDLKKIFISSIFIGIFFSLSGLYFSYNFNLPSGAVIVLCASIGYILSLIINVSIQGTRILK